MIFFTIFKNKKINISIDFTITNLININIKNKKYNY